MNLYSILLFLLEWYELEFTKKMGGRNWRNIWSNLSIGYEVQLRMNCWEKTYSKRCRLDGFLWCFKVEGGTSEPTKKKRKMRDNGEILINYLLIHSILLPYNFL